MGWIHICVTNSVICWYVSVFFLVAIVWLYFLPLTVFVLLAGLNVPLPNKQL